MKFLLTIFLLLSPVLTQIKATTTEGDNVLLNDDGTWSYENQVDISSEDLGIWEVKYFVDDFGDPTNEGYISSNIIDGTFSNSATTNSKLKLYFIISNEDIGMKLFEYGSNVLKTTRKVEYKIIFKHNGVRFDKPVSGVMYSDRLYIVDNINSSMSSDFFRDLLKQGGDFNFVITELGSYASSSYKFKFNADGYSNAHSTIFTSSKK